MKKVVLKKCSRSYGKKKRDVSGITPSSVANDAVHKMATDEKSYSRNVSFLFTIGT